MKSNLFVLVFALVAIVSTQRLLAADAVREGRPPVGESDLVKRFDSPPAEARPQVYWFWMGGLVSKEGIAKDLAALKEAGFGGTTMCHLSDICTPWAQQILNAPPSDVVAYQSESWWQLVRFAASESRRLGLEFGIHNCAGYESSGGPWVTPEHSMQEIVWSETRVTGPAAFAGTVPRPSPDLHARQPFPFYDLKTGVLEKPIVPARQSYFRDVAVLAMPATGAVARDKIIDLSNRVDADGKLTWDVPPGEWIVYRFGHTTTGAMLQPCQGGATGLECDKMSREAVELHLRHVLGEAKKNLGDLVGNGLTYLWFDSYEAGTPSWTPRMREEFAARRGYELTPFLATFARRVVGNDAETKKFKDDFTQTMHDLYRDVYFATIQRECHAAGLQARSEPYQGPWKVSEAVPFFDQVSAEFWTNNGKYTPLEVKDVVAAGRKANMPVLSAEAFTGRPRDSQWTETPAWLKPIGDAAFCDGINRLMLHRFVHQPFDDRWRPGVSMGQWGTHFDRTQTWWEPGKAWVRYLQRCQSLLQWGEQASADVSVEGVTNGLTIKAVRRADGTADVFFVANLTRSAGAAGVVFPVSDRRPELWDPVTGERRALPAFTVRDGKTVVPMEFAAAQSAFVVFRNRSVPATKIDATNFPVSKALVELTGPWSVKFDPKWGGPENVVTFDTLTDWTARPESGIRYFSGTAVYTKAFDLPGEGPGNAANVWIDLGTVHALAEVELNGVNLGVVWTAPWHVRANALLRPTGNTLVVRVTNVWANRLIGDEQEPADCEWAKGDEGFGGPLKAFPDWFVKGQKRPASDRYAFTTWNYFNKSSPLSASGLLGPVRVVVSQ